MHKDAIISHKHGKGNGWSSQWLIKAMDNPLGEHEILHLVAL